MTRLCRFNHLVHKHEDKCSEGHHLCATLDCSVRGCKYTTRPHSIADVKPAIEMMKLHMIGAHPELEDQLKASKTNEDKSEKKTVDAENIIKKRKEIDPSKDITCPNCYKLFYSKKNVKRHIKTQHERIQRLNCNDCDQTFASSMALNYHMKRSHPPKSGLKCDSCGDTFPNFKKYAIHARSHESSRDHKCDECHALFSSNSNLNRHISEEHQIVNYNVKKITVMTYPFTCDECDFYTKRKHYLQVHKHLQHSPDSFERIPCDHCSKTFEYKSNLRRHERRYHESKMLISDILNTIIVKSAMM